VKAVLAGLAERTGSTPRLIELVDAAPAFFAALTADRLAGEGKALVKLIEAADVVVVGSPVYRASYTGAFKHLFDLVRPDVLAGKPVALMATGGSQLHGLVTEHQLRPLFASFGAQTLPTAIYAGEADFRDYRITSQAIQDRVERVVNEAVAFLDARAPAALSVAARAARLPLTVDA
jgi:FMN reductase